MSFDARGPCPCPYCNHFILLKLDNNRHCQRLSVCLSSYRSRILELIFTRFFLLSILSMYLLLLLFGQVLSYISLKLVRRLTNQGKMLKDRAIEQRLMQRNSFVSHVSRIKLLHSVIPAYFTFLFYNYIVLFFSPTKYTCKCDFIHIVFCLVVFSCCFEE